jgi:ATP diphosphatase
LNKIDKLLNIMKELRNPERGCPWDLEQTFLTIAPYTIEEAYEVAEAIHKGDTDELQEELGDLLFQVVFHAQLADEKMLRRHPHVFGDAEVKDAREQAQAWEKHKHKERQLKLKKQEGSRNLSALDGVPIALPALTRAVKLQRRAARVGFDWSSLPPILAKIEEELEEVNREIEQQAAQQLIEDEVGDLFFAVTNLARHLEIDPETAVRRSSVKFERRFKAIEKLADEKNQQLQEMSLDEMEILYQEVKRKEGKAQ